MNTKSNDIRVFPVTGDWAVESKDLRRKFARLTDEDLKFEKGKEDALMKQLEVKLAEKRQELIGIIQNIKR